MISLILKTLFLCAENGVIDSIIFQHYSYYIVSVIFFSRGREGVNNRSTLRKPPYIRHWLTWSYRILRLFPVTDENWTHKNFTFGSDCLDR